MLTGGYIAATWLTRFHAVALTVATGDLSGSHEADSRFARHMDIHKVRLNKDGKVIVAKGKTVEYQAPISIQDFAFGHSASLNLQGTAKVSWEQVVYLARFI